MKQHDLLRLLKYIFKHNKIKCLFALLGIILSVGTSVAGSYMISTLINDHITPLIGVKNPNLEGLFRFISYLVICYIVSLIALTLYTKLMMYVNQKTLKTLRDELYAHLEKMPIGYFDKNSHGDLMSRFTNDIDALRQMISQALPQIISTFCSVIFVLVVMFKLNIVLASITVLLLAVMLFSMNILKKFSSKYFISQQANVGKMNGYINEMINGQRVIKVFNHEEEAIKDFEVINQELYESGAKANKIANIGMPLLMNIGIISYVIILIIGSYIAINYSNTFKLGDLAAYLILLRQLTNPVAVVSMQLNSIIMASAGASRIFNLLDQDIEFDEGYVRLINGSIKNNELVEDEFGNIPCWLHQHKNGEITIKKVLGEVRFFDVDFGYSEDKIVLHNISLYALPGQKIALVGATGAGKTTITNLINRFYEVADGKVRIDGINISKIRKPDLRKSLGIVLQDVNLFTGSIKDNISFGKVDATTEEVIAASKLANADSFINLLPDGYDTIISDNGSNLSSGQRQLISIARTAIINPPILILDEATSSVDTRTEKLIQQGMDKLMEGKTVFVIAHRLSTIKNADAIMVLDHGRIIERGNHEELLENKGVYYQLYTGAFELE